MYYVHVLKNVVKIKNIIYNKFITEGISYKVMIYLLCTSVSCQMLLYDASSLVPPPLFLIRCNLNAKKNVTVNNRREMARLT